MLWDILCTLILLRLAINLNLESGSQPGDYLPGDDHREASSVDREDTQKEQAGTRVSASFFHSEMKEEKHLLQCLWPKSKDS